MRRRNWLVSVALLAAGCSSSTKPPKKSRLTGRQRMNRGPQGFGNVLVTAYIDDLKNGSADKKIAAARELSNMGTEARSALPVLEKLASDKNGKVSAAAKAAATAIKKQ